MQYNRTVGCVQIHIDTKRIDENIRNAQKLLNMRIVMSIFQWIKARFADPQIILTEYMAVR